MVTTRFSDRVEFNQDEIKGRTFKTTKMKQKEEHLKSPKQKPNEEHLRPSVHKQEEAIGDHQDRTKRKHSK